MLTRRQKLRRSTQYFIVFKSLQSRPTEGQPNRRYRQQSSTSVRQVQARVFSFYSKSQGQPYLQIIRINILFQIKVLYKLSNLILIRFISYRYSRNKVCIGIIQNLIGPRGIRTIVMPREVTGPPYPNYTIASPSVNVSNRSIRSSFYKVLNYLEPVVEIRIAFVSGIIPQNIVVK